MRIDTWARCVSVYCIQWYTQNDFPCERFPNRLPSAVCNIHTYSRRSSRGAVCRVHRIANLICRFRDENNFQRNGMQRRYDTDDCRTAAAHRDIPTEITSPGPARNVGGPRGSCHSPFRRPWMSPRTLIFIVPFPRAVEREGSTSRSLPVEHVFSHLRRPGKMTF